MFDAGLERGDPKRVGINLQPDGPGLWARRVLPGRGARGMMRQSRERDLKGPRSSIIRFVIIQNGTINALVAPARKEPQAAANGFRPGVVDIFGMPRLWCKRYDGLI